jgi:hypothetical protein
MFGGRPAQLSPVQPIVNYQAARAARIVDEVFFP